ncbi:MAG: 1,4-alpha-glucan branching protein GlgB [Rhodobacteraceae bacterium]|nr:1,4-alpha-glucan branching protein GlgB [Paracoccaceae bacterium]
MPHSFNSQDIQNLLNASHRDPFSLLGPHMLNNARWVSAIDPGADRLFAVTTKGRFELQRVEGALFSGNVPGHQTYKLHGIDGNGATWDYEDAYRFGTLISREDEALIAAGKHPKLWHVLGAHSEELDGVSGVRFGLWAPHASRVSVVGAFNNWDGLRHMMRWRGGAGIWEIFVPGAKPGDHYKYEMIGANGILLPHRADPVGFGGQYRPETASIVRDLSLYGWQDGAWMSTRGDKNQRSAPISIYEVHLGSWRRVESDGNRPLSYIEHATQLIDYVVEMGFTHIELMPISEFPFDGSWGYQPVGLYAPTIRFGPPDEFRDLVSAAHAAGLGILLDWVPGHFPADEHGLGYFDGTCLYEHADPREGFHQDWNTLIYNYGRKEVANYLTSNAQYWLEEYHIDGLRVDAVASMLYRDYSRAEGEWVPNHDGGRENYEAIAFLRQMNIVTYGAHAGIMNVAEESTSFPKVSSPVDAGGLGFGYKWNMGWMNDSLRYMQEDPINRKYHHGLMTFGIDYAFSENFVLPISHDEVVHGKGSMIEKMPGNWWDKCANLRAYYGFMWAHPGKKLLFMGCEFGQPSEWNHDTQLDWEAAARPDHAGIKDLVRDLNHTYKSTPALYAKDCDASGFEWIDGGDADSSILSFARYGNDGDPPCLVICNFTPVERTGFRQGVPQAGRWDEIINTDAQAYGGSGKGNLGGAASDAVAAHGRDHSINITLPPLSTLIFSLKT